MKSDWSIPERAIIIETSKIIGFWLSSKIIFFSHKPQIDNTCKLHSKCLKKEESLDNCNSRSARMSFIWVDSRNYWLHLQRMSGSVHCCGKRCFNFLKMHLSWPQTKAKEECHGILMVLHLNSTLWHWSSIDYRWQLQLMAWWRQAKWYDQYEHCQWTKSTHQRQGTSMSRPII